jgi:hypothetical protein
MVARHKPSSLLGPFISYEENVVLLIESQKDKGFHTFDKCVKTFFGARTFGQREVLSTKGMKTVSTPQVKAYLHVCFKSTILH